MHELGIASDLFEIIKEKTRENNLKKITKVRIRLGIASGIEKDHLAHSFIAHVFPNTIAHTAKLELVDEPFSAWCKDCSKVMNTVDNFTLNCPDCGSYNIEITGGKDIYIESIEGDAI